ALKARVEYELMRCCSDHGAESAQEMVWTHCRRIREFGEPERLVRLRLDQSQGGGDPPCVTSAWIASFPLRAHKRRVDSAGQIQCDFLEFGFGVAPAARRSCGDDGQQCG